MDWTGIFSFLLLVLFGFVSFLLIGVVLIQKGRGGGLASAFGGGSGTATAFGAKTGDVLTWATSVIFGIFLLLAIVLNLIANHRSPPINRSVMPMAPVPAAPEVPMTPLSPSMPVPTPSAPVPTPSAPVPAPVAPATQP